MSIYQNQTCIIGRDTGQQDDQNQSMETLDGIRKEGVK